MRKWGHSRYTMKIKTLNKTNEKVVKTEDTKKQDKKDSSK